MKKLLVLVIFLVSFIIFGFTTVPVDAKAGDVYTQDFSDIEEVNRDFGAYYLYTMGGLSEKTQVAADPAAGTNWYIADNTLIRQEIADDIDISIDTNSYAILTLETQTYVNFELTVDYKAGSDTYYWPVVAFRQNEKGKYFLEDGAGVFVQTEGFVTLWGGEGVSGPYESAVVPGYSSQANEWHTMKIIMDGVNLDVYIDDMTQPAFTRTLQSGFFKGGYISLISVNNSSSFRNLKIVEMPVIPVETAPEQEPLPDAGTEDSLDTIGTPIDEIDELAGLTQNDNNDEDETAPAGCAGKTVWPYFGLLPLLIVFFKRKTKSITNG